MNAHIKILAFVLMLIPLISVAEAPLRVNVMALSNSTPDDETRIHKAILLIEEVLAKEEFKNSILLMKYRVANKEYPGFSQTSLTPPQIWETIVKARENFDGGFDGSIDLFLNMYYDASSTVGYTSYSDKYIHMNRYFHQSYSPAEVSRNITHEWLHKLNHDHPKKDNAFRPHSVPYKIGELMMDMAASIVSQGDPLLKNILLTPYECKH